MTKPCPLCGGSNTNLHATATDIEYFTSDQTFSYFRCQDCAVLFVAPMLHDRLSEIYPSNYYAFKPSDGGIVQRIKQWLDRRIFRSVLKQIPGANLAALDVGGGSGWLLDVVKQSDSRVTKTQVVDIDPGARDAAISAGHGYFLGPIEDFETTERFDLILMLNLIEHVRRPDQILAKARSLLTPDGLLLIKTPNYDALDASLFRHRSWGGYHAPRHFVLFTRESFTQIAEKQGLAVQSFAYTQGAPFWAISMANELRRMGLVKGSREKPLVYHPLIPLFQAAFAGFDLIRRPLARLSQMIFVMRIQASKYAGAAR